MKRLISHLPIETYNMTEFKMRHGKFSTHLVRQVPYKALDTPRMWNCFPSNPAVSQLLRKLQDNQLKRFQPSQE